MITLLHWCMYRGKWAARALFRACFTADASEQLWRWMSPREPARSHIERRV